MGKKSTDNNPYANLAVAVLLGLLLLALSYARIIGDAGSAAFGGKIIDAAMAGPVWGTQLGDNLVVFAATLALIHIAFGVLCLVAAALSRRAWPDSPNSQRTWLIFWFAIGTIWLLVANAAFFPWSSLGSFYGEHVAENVLGISVFTVATFLLCAGLGWLLACLLWRHRYFLRGKTLGTAGSLMLACFVIAALNSAQGDSRGRTAAPHVILIGLDSLRADAIKGQDGRTPGIDRFMQSAVHFTDATTPLARTFPSWVSIISGRHPHTTGAVINLLPREMIKTGDTLPDLLKGNGYQTIYAIDEVRFSNLDQSYGFDQMIAPPIGATDFLLGFFGDAPLLNLLANTSTGEVLFPYLHANRAAAHIYDPDTFIDRLDDDLEFDKPTFLAVHLTLAHWPYYWSQAPEQPSKDGISTGRRYYDPAVQRLDQQFQDLMALLANKGALDNAIVAVISDHGESLGSMDTDSTSSTRPRIGAIYEEEHLVGHGTSVFSPHQYQVVFAMRAYGNQLISGALPRTVDAPVSLEDFTPTVLDLLSLKGTAPFDGTSLADILRGSADGSLLAGRVRFTETEFNPKGIAPGIVISGSAMEDAARYYKVDPSTDRVLVRRELLSEVLEQRQFAALRNGKLLAAIPITTPQGSVYRPVYVDGDKDPIVLTDPDSSFDPNVAVLWGALENRFPRLSERDGHGS